MTRYTVLWLSVIDWHAPWDGQQALAWRLAADGHTVTFVETPGVRTVTSRDWHRLIRRLGNRVQGGLRGFRPLAQNLWLFSPVLLPFPGHAWADRINRQLMLFSLRQMPFSAPAMPLLVWTYLPTPLAIQLIGDLQPARLVYYCYNDIVNNPAGVAPGTRESEIWLVRHADHVFATSRQMVAERRTLNPHTTYMPAGADIVPFLQQWPEPDDLAPLPHPRLLFFGALDVWLDQELLTRVAQTIPHATVILIGPARCNLDRMRHLPNVHLLGPRTHDELPAYLHHADLFLIPYQVNAYTANIHPVKTYEALATGKPLVTTALPELEAYQGPVTVAHDADAFIRGIEQGLAEDDPAQAGRRRSIAHRNTWDSRYQTIKEHLPDLA
jgi:glycosyltransferase involved in cell wall biosynthesis